MYRILFLAAIVILFSCKDKQNKANDSVITETPKQKPAADTTLTEEENFFIKDPENASDGERVQFYKSGTKKSQGTYKNGKREGKWQVWYSNGQLWSECDFKNGLKHGNSAVYFRNGAKRYEGRYENDNRVGVWKFYDETGKLIKEEEVK